MEMQFSNTTIALIAILALLILWWFVSNRRDTFDNPGKARGHRGIPVPGKALGLMKPKHKKPLKPGKHRGKHRALGHLKMTATPGPLIA